MTGFWLYFLNWLSSSQKSIMSKFQSSKSFYMLFETNCLLTTNRRCLTFSNIFVLVVNFRCTRISFRFRKISWKFSDSAIKIWLIFVLVHVSFRVFVFFDELDDDISFVVFQCSNKFLSQTFVSNSFDRWARFRKTF